MELTRHNEEAWNELVQMEDRWTVPINSFSDVIAPIIISLFACQGID